MALHADGRVCSSKDVPACSKSAANCNSFSGKTKNLVDNNFPDVFGKVCEEPSGEQCVRTNVDYTTCKDSAGKCNEACAQICTGMN